MRRNSYVVNEVIFSPNFFYIFLFFVLLNSVDTGLPLSQDFSVYIEISCASTEQKISNTYIHTYTHTYYQFIYLHAYFVRQFRLLLWHLVYNKIYSKSILLRVFCPFVHLF